MTLITLIENRQEVKQERNMENQNSVTKPRKVRKLGLIAGLAIGTVIALLFALVAGRAQSGILATLWSAVTGRDTRIVSQNAIVERVQRLQRLETVVYNMDKIVSGERSNPILPDFLAGDRVLMIVHGQVVAGIDFAQLQNGDITVTGKQVHVRLPRAQVLMTRVDNAKTRVYSRNTGLLVPVDMDLETQVRQQAERELTEEALQGGILDAARTNARATVTSLLLGLGFEKVDVE
ncbi:MAG TPA: DUF4230 domain-containing protein [Candidatus Angelobacter sp.]|nr:DUF4230 domain-containing protein [Candidatus Angelobacter sp.]